MQPISSSYDSAKWSGRASVRRVISGTSASAAAMKLFMSQTPRPTRRSSTSMACQGSESHGWPSTGTTSVWPDSTMPPSIGGPMVAKRFAFLPESSNVRRESTPCPRR